MHVHMHIYARACVVCACVRAGVCVCIYENMYTVGYLPCSVGNTIPIVKASFDFRNVFLLLTRVISRLLCLLYLFSIYNTVEHTVKLQISSPWVSTPVLYFDFLEDQTVTIHAPST